MVGNIQGGNNLGGNFPGGAGDFPGGSLIGGNFPGASFPVGGGVFLEPVLSSGTSQNKEIK